jgi:drug/metabolite transporter (DMT)-like permease
MMGVSNGLTFWGQQHVPASLAALLFCTMPFFAAALSCLLLRGERFTFGILIGLPMGFCGVWLALSGRLYGVSASSGLGTLSIIGAAMTWALGIVFSKRLLARTSTVLISGIQLIVGSVPLLLVSWLWGEAWSEIIVSRESIAVMLVMIFAQGCVAYILYYWILSRVGPTILALTSFVSPSIAVVLGVVLLGEQGGWELVVGLITIGLAIGIVNLLTHPVADHG